MPKFFTTLEKAKPFYDVTYKVVLVLCKLLLIADILITSYAVAGRLFNKYVPFLTCMSYMAVLSAALAIRQNAHIRMTAFDRNLSPLAIAILDLIADIGVIALGFVMLFVGWRYATTLGGRGFYVSMPWLSRFWMYFPVPLAGLAMIIFELETIFNHIKRLYELKTAKRGA